MYGGYPPHQPKKFAKKVEKWLVKNNAKVTLSESTEIYANDKIMDKEVKQNFSFWLSIIKDCTDYSDEELNEYSLEELVQMSSVIIENANKKKLKK